MSTLQPRYHCAVQSHMQVELHNVQMQHPSLFVAGSPSAVGWAALGVGAARILGGIRQRALEGQIRYVPASGWATLTDDMVSLHLVASRQTPGVTITSGDAARTIDANIPYGVIRRFGAEPAGVYLDTVTHGVIWLQPADHGEFVQWLAHLSHQKTWRTPIPTEFAHEVATAGWVQQDPRFGFELPAGWNEVRDPVGVGAFAQEVYPSLLRTLVGVTAGDLEAHFVVLEEPAEEPPPAEIAPDELVATGVALMARTPCGPAQVGQVGGVPAALVRAVGSAAGQTTDRTYVLMVRGGLWLGGLYEVIGATPGDGAHEHWLPDLRTMLATWRWS